MKAKSAPATFFVTAMLLGTLLAALGGQKRALGGESWRAIVDPWVLASASDANEAEFLVYLSEQADLSQAAYLTTKRAKGRFVYERLTEVASRTQSPVMMALDGIGAEYRSYWVANMLWVRGDITIVQTIAERPDVAHIYANPAVDAGLRGPIPTLNQVVASPSVEWNIERVNADDVWLLGYSGQGVVVGGQDTGYDWQHPALREQYRGWDGTGANHNYSWHDAIHSQGGSCGHDSQSPCDDHGHGTHTMGTMVGGSEGGPAIGMAPGAQWIGCRNMDRGIGTPATYSECYQWFIAPTDITGSNADPDKAPHVINNSWSCPPSEGCTDPGALLTVVENVRSAGILTVHSAGNSGPLCSSVNAPAAIYDESFTVGATTFDGDIASYSSRGPVSVDGSARLKPDISAPGSGILSSVRGGGYGYGSGTSMAAPHVAGLAALLISANSSLAGEVSELESIMQQTAVPKTSEQSCGGIPGDQIPNNTFGYGRIDAKSAVLRRSLALPLIFHR